MSGYTVIKSNGDGELRVEFLNQVELLKRLNTGYYGEGEINIKMADEITEPDHNYWGEVLLIIPALPIMPKVVEQVTKYELP